MKRPYIKKIGEFNGFKAFYVNGYYLRKFYDKEFTNFGTNKYFDFIPKNEVWIDYENGNKEAEYFLDNFFAIQKELKKGKTYDEAVKIANILEKRQRDKSQALKKIKSKPKKDILKHIHKKQIFKKYTKNLKIWIVRGDLVRSLYFLDYTEGGHDKVYKFVPKNEVWIDDDVYKKEIPFVLVHELHERYLMSKGWVYDSEGIGVFTRKARKGTKSAHFAAEKLETWCRNHPKKVKDALIKEINNNEKFIKASNNSKIRKPKK